MPKLAIKGDSQLMIGQVKGKFQAKEPQLARYLLKVKEMMGEFNECTMKYILREQNSRANLLSKLASTKTMKTNRSII